MKYLVILCFFVPPLLYSQTTKDLRVAVNQLPTSLHPYAANANAELLHFYIRPLTLPSLDAVWECALCNELPILGKDSLTIERRGKNRFLHTKWQLRDKLTWSDGKKISLNDFAFAWSVIKALADAQITTHELVYEIDEMKISDNREFLMINFIGSQSDFANLPRFYPLPSHIEKPIFDTCNGDAKCYLQQSQYMKNPSLPGLSCGPYQIKSKSTNELILTPNDKFAFPKIKHKIDQIKILDLESPNLSAKSLGSFDLVLPETLSTIAAINLEKQVSADLNRDNYKFEYPESDHLNVLVLNLRNPTFRTAALRRALFEVVNRKQILDRIFGGAHRIPIDPFDQPWWQTLPPNPDAGKSTPEAIAKLFDEAGWTLRSGSQRRSGEHVLAFTLTYGTQPPEKKSIADMMVKQFATFAIPVKLEEVTADKMRRFIVPRADFRDAIILTWDLGRGLSPKSLFHSKETPSYANQYYGQNISGWRNNKVDEVLEQWEDTFDRNERLVILKDWRKEFNEDSPFLPLYFELTPSVVTKKLKGYRATPAGITASRYAEFWEWDE